MIVKYKNQIKIIIGNHRTATLYDFNGYIKIRYLDEEGLVTNLFVKSDQLDKLLSFKKPKALFNHAIKHDLGCGIYNDEYEEMFQKYCLDNNLKSVNSYF